VPIIPFLKGERFDLEGGRVLRVAFEMACIALRAGDCDDHVKQAVAHEAHRTRQSRRTQSRYFVRRGIEGHWHAPTVGRIRSCAVFGPGRTEGSELGTRQHTAMRRAARPPWLRSLRVGDGSKITDRRAHLTAPGVRFRG
jgi:hypothetical protein